jgi:hypothetical protein
MRPAAHRRGFKTISTSLQEYEESHEPGEREAETDHG